jgi:hypothetical protein
MSGARSWEAGRTAQAVWLGIAIVGSDVSA